MVAEEDSAELRRPAGRPMLDRITQLINSVLGVAEPGVMLSAEDVLELIGGVLVGQDTIGASGTDLLHRLFP